MNKDQSRFTEHTHEPRAQDTEEAALRHMWRSMGYGNTPGLPDCERPLNHPTTTCTEPIVPTITLTEATPPSSQEEPATSQRTTTQVLGSIVTGEDARLAMDQHLHEMYQWHPLTTTSHDQDTGLPPTQSSNLPPIYFIPRPVEDYQNMLQAMATGNFNIPIFGAAGAAFHNRLVAQQAQGVPAPPPSSLRAGAFSGPHQHPTWLRESVNQPIPDTPTPQPRKRKRTQALRDEDSQGNKRAPKKPAGRKK